MTFQELKDEYISSGSIYSKQECFIAGVQYSAKMTQRVGEILQEVTNGNIPPKYVVELRDIFRENKEILDEQT